METAVAAASGSQYAVGSGSRTSRTGRTGTRCWYLCGKRCIAGTPAGRNPFVRVTCVLSGMNSLDMVRENLKTASNAAPGCMTEASKALVARVKEEIRRSVKVGCTGVLLMLLTRQRDFMELVKRYKK